MHGPLGQRPHLSCYHSRAAGFKPPAPGRRSTEASQPDGLSRSVHRSQSARFRTGVGGCVQLRKSQDLLHLLADPLVVGNGIRPPGDEHRLEDLAVGIVLAVEGLEVEPAGHESRTVLQAVEALAPDHFQSPATKILVAAGKPAKPELRKVVPSLKKWTAVDQQVADPQLDSTGIGGLVALLRKEDTIDDFEVHHRDVPGAVQPHSGPDTPPRRPPGPPGWRRVSAARGRPPGRDSCQPLFGCGRRSSTTARMSPPAWHGNARRWHRPQPCVRGQARQLAGACGRLQGRGRGVTITARRAIIHRQGN